MTSRQTPLYHWHLEHGGRMVPFAGWDMPVQYTGIIQEHQATRQKAGIFDVSHMGEIFMEGPGAEAALNYLTCNDVGKLGDGQAQYSAITNQQGGMVDDIIIYRLSAENYMLCVNAANVSRDLEWLSANNRQASVEISDRSDEFAQLALQGPEAVKILAGIPAFSGAVNLAFFGFAVADLKEAPVIVARTGYTGEDGFEFFLPPEAAKPLWELLMERGAACGLTPVGLGARDSLRLEAAYPLHGHELSGSITAIESGLGWIVKPAKGEYIGHEVLNAQKKNGAPRTLVGFFVEGGIARHADKAFSSDGVEVGFVTSGTRTPTLERALGMALLPSAMSAVGTEFFIEVRGRKLRAEVVKRPFYSRSKS